MHKRLWNIFQKCFSRFHIQKEKLLKSCEKKLWRMKDFGSIFDLEIIRDYPDKCFHPSIIICMEKNMQNMQKKRYKKFSETETSCLNQLSAFLAFFLFPGSQKKLCGIMRDYVVRTPPPEFGTPRVPKTRRNVGNPRGVGHVLRVLHLLLHQHAAGQPGVLRLQRVRHAGLLVGLHQPEPGAATEVWRRMAALWAGFPQILTRDPLYFFRIFCITVLIFRANFQLFQLKMVCIYHLATRASEF